jgi:hypothetical protein
MIRCYTCTLHKISAVTALVYTCFAKMSCCRGQAWSAGWLMQAKPLLYVQVMLVLQLAMSPLTRARLVYFQCRQVLQRHATSVKIVRLYAKVSHWQLRLGLNVTAYINYNPQPHSDNHVPAKPPTIISWFTSKVNWLLPASVRQSSMNGS